MEKRTVLAFVICGIITLFWLWHMQSAQQKRAEELRKRQQEALKQKQKLAPESKDEPQPKEPARKPDDNQPEAPQVAKPVDFNRDIRISRPGLRHETVWTNRGGALLEARLVPTKDGKYRDSVAPKRGVHLLKGLNHGRCTFTLEHTNSQDPFNLHQANYDYNRDYGQAGAPLVFSQTFRDRLEVKKTFSFKPDRYAIDVTIELRNVDRTETPGPIKNMAYRIAAAARMLPESPSDIYVAGLIGRRTGPDKWKFTSGAPAAVAKNASSFALPSSRGEPITWAGATDRYFAGILTASGATRGEVGEFIASASMEHLSKEMIEADDKKNSTQQSGAAEREPPSAPTSYTGNGAHSTRQPPSKRELIQHRDSVEVFLETKPFDIAPGQTVTHKYTYFLGPKKAQFLANPDYPGIEGVLDYGWFGFISRILLGILAALYAVFRNYGVGIIFLTIVVKIILHPLTRKGQISMHKVQKLQPLIRELQAKHKDDRQRLGREQMELFKKHGANPMSGCWPLLCQIPVFFGLFNMLRYSVDLRHEAFLWVRDLSQPDTVTLKLGFPLNILPILMVVSWVVQQATQPKPVDPQQLKQRKMMMFLPIVFGFLLYNSPSGLILYWFTSTFLGIFEQKFIKYQIQKMEARGDFPTVQAEASPAKATRPKARRR